MMRGDVDDSWGFWGVTTLEIALSVAIDEAAKFPDQVCLSLEQTWTHWRGPEA